MAQKSRLQRLYDILLFDVGYTLIYFEPAQELVVQQALQTLGVERSVVEITAAAGRVWGAYYENAETDTFPPTQDHDRQTQSRLEGALLAQLKVGGGQESLETYTAAIEARFSSPDAIHSYPEVVDVLTLLQAKGYRLGIVSNWSWNLKDRVAQAGLDHFFEVIWASAYAGCNKPHPGIFDSALSQLSPPAAPTDRILYVGDSYQHDIIGARNAGLDAVLLDRGGIATATDCPVIHDLWGILDLLTP